MPLTQVQGQMLNGSTNTTTTIQSNGTTAITIDASQNVGVGTSSPLGKFDVGGASTATVNTGIYVHGTDNASYGQFVALRRNGSNSLIMGDAGAILGSGGGASVFYTYGANYQAFWTNGTERMRIDSSGNVGIGGTPTNKFTILTGSTNLSAQLDGSTAYWGTYSNHPLAFATNGAERMRLDTSGNLQFNSGYGSVATAYGCRAWVNFNGTGTVAIRASGNVTSITDNGTGDYTVNFTTAMPDANYSVNAIGYADNVSYNLNMYLTEATAPTTSLFRVVSRQTNTTASFDSARVYLAVFR
jgi:hypothetical protein